MDVSSPVAIGSDFLGYRIEELLGRGGMGVVYRAYDLRLKRPVALKLVAPALARDERFRERFARESELVMSLEHPNVVPIYDAGDFEGHVYLAMRLVDGRDLGSLLRSEGALEPARAIAVCTQIASALDAAHARELVHRDVKPSNVLLDSSEHVYLADFGLTRRLDGETGEALEDLAVGTPAYLAPEQLDAGPVDGSADVYALGCVLYECLTGEPVFVRSSRLAVAWAHLEEEPPKPSERRTELPQAIDAVIDRALAKDPAQRYSTCTSLIGAAGQALGLGAARASRRRRTLLAGLGAVAVVVSAALVALYLAHRGTPAPLYAAEDTLARIDPMSRKVETVIPIGTNPVVSAGYGRHLWVYSEGGGRIWEVDTRPLRVVEHPIVSPLPPAECCGLYTGPVWAADASGAWFVKGGFIGKPQLVHLPVGRRPMRHYPLSKITPTGVAVGARSVWIVGIAPHGYEVLRVDPTDGHVTASRRFPPSAKIDSIAYGYGWVWVASSTKSTLYRLEPRLQRPPQRLQVSDSRATRPEMIKPYVWVRVEGHNGERFMITPDPLKKLRWLPDGPPTAEENVWGLGARWTYDSPTGVVVQQTEENGPTHSIRVTEKLPGQGGPCLSSIATVDGSVWVTVAPLLDEGSSFICQR